jgi:hypothetical protein
LESHSDPEGPWDLTSSLFTLTSLILTVDAGDIAGDVEANCSARGDIEGDGAGVGVLTVQPNKSAAPSSSGDGIESVTDSQCWLRLDLGEYSESVSNAKISS